MDIYDTIIVGGGISGLYAGWLIMQKYPKHRLLILEKERYLGGRILTYKDKYMNVEKGGARFNEYHTRVLNLLADCGLDSQIIEASPDALFYPGKGVDPDDIKPISFLESLINPVSVLVNVWSEAISALPMVPLIARVIIYSKVLSRSYLISHTFTQIAEEILTKEEIATIHGGFGYYTELAEMNARDAIALMEGGLNPRNRFFVLRGGLSQLIARMVADLNRGERRILTDVGVASIEYPDNHFIVKSKSGKKFYGLGCICALPREAAQRLDIFRPISGMLDKILCFPLYFNTIICTDTGQAGLTTSYGNVYICSNGMANLAWFSTASVNGLQNWSNFTTTNNIPKAAWSGLCVNYNESFAFANTDGNVYIYSKPVVV